jgi:hypothetical protein
MSYRRIRQCCTLWVMCIVSSSTVKRSTRLGRLLQVCAYCISIARNTTNIAIADHTWNTPVDCDVDRVQARCTSKCGQCDGVALAIRIVGQRDVSVVGGEQPFSIAAIASTCIGAVVLQDVDRYVVDGDLHNAWRNVACVASYWIEFTVSSTTTATADEQQAHQLGSCGSYRGVLHRPCTLPIHLELDLETRRHWSNFRPCCESKHIVPWLW